MAPLLIGKFGDYYDQVNMAWMWRASTSTPRLGTFVGGFQAFLDLLAGSAAAGSAYSPEHAGAAYRARRWGGLSVVVGRRDV